MATATSVWSRFVVRPTLAEYAMASSALRFLSSKVCRMRRWYSARFAWFTPATVASEPSAPTTQGPASGAVAFSKNCLPSVLVRAGPPPPW